ncbi:hypothetical protein B0A50_01709 [Salinomyces thailandicus]|uniref:Uncharacterized protein n=1 Tax=Salinomyces thailandicus TaxID=706561 RepID=A0A4U0UAB8_9PEZI|nr:hypothetical protein B0A50_01709 [Salinomyces thailandica]
MTGNNCIIDDGLLQVVPATSGQPGSRGVANLTPEQLSRKRANDRDAQRGIHTRAKQTLEAKDRRIAELESQQPHQDLQKVKDELDKVCVEREQAEVSHILLLTPHLRH